MPEFSLSPTDRAIYRLILEGKNLYEISKILHITVEDISSRIDANMERMRDCRIIDLAKEFATVRIGN